MRLGKFIMEDRVPGNRERRERLGLPWLSFSSDRYDLGEAVTEAEQETGLDVKVGLWKNRVPPDEIVLIGKFAGDGDDAELPLYVVPVTPPKAAAPAPPQAAAPAGAGLRLAKDERVLVKVAARIIRMERQFLLVKWLAALAGLVSLLAVAAMVVVAVLLLRK